MHVTGRTLCRNDYESFIVGDLPIGSFTHSFTGCIVGSCNLFILALRISALIMICVCVCVLVRALALCFPKSTNQ